MSHASKGMVSWKRGVQRDLRSRGRVAHGCSDKQACFPAVVWLVHARWLALARWGVLRMGDTKILLLLTLTVSK